MTQPQKLGRPDLLVTWAIVNYRSRDVVLGFAGELARRFATVDVELRLAVGDNSPVTEISESDLAEVCGDVAHMLNPDPTNPGYMPGALNAVDALGGASSDWVVVSNADLEFRTDPAEWFRSLASRYGRDEAICIAPQVFCLGTRSMLNPHIKSRPSTPSVLVRWLLTRSRFGLRLMEWRSRRSRRRRAVEPTAPQTNEEEIYAAHGSIWILSRAALAAIRPAIDSAPLYAEEFAVAESCRRAGIPIRFVPAFEMAHEPHASTGLATTPERARRWSVAYSHIVRHFLPLRPLSPPRPRSKTA